MLFKKIGGSMTSCQKLPKEEVKLLNSEDNHHKPQPEMLPWNTSETGITELKETGPQWPFHQMEVTEFQKVLSSHSQLSAKKAAIKSFKDYQSQKMSKPELTKVFKNYNKNKEWLQV